MMDRDKQYLHAILREISVMKTLLRNYNEATFLKSERTQRAICMTLLNIGEIVKSISDDLKQNHPEIPWREISGLRDMAAHKYRVLLMERIWDTALNDIPELQEGLKIILKKHREK